MFGLYPGTVAALTEIFSRHENVGEVIIYGSRAKGNYREGSDIDMTIIGEISTAEFSKIYSEIDESPIPYLFDLSVYSQLNSESLKDHIKRVGKTFYKKSV